jgi:hypothetical protein
MGDGLIYWYRKPMSAAAIADQLQRFNSAGMVLENMMSHRVMLIDQTGEQIKTTPDALIADLASGRNVSFQFWIDEWTDVYCRFRTVAESLQVQEYSLNGTTADQRLQVQWLLWDTFGRNLDDSEALVVDIYARTEDTDWDGAVIAHMIPPEPLPDLLARLHQIELGSSLQLNTSGVQPGGVRSAWATGSSQ